MFSFSYNFANDDKGVEDAKIIKVGPTFNNKNVLEFSLGPDKRFLKLSETHISVQMEIPDNYWFDNDAVNKQIESLEISIAHENVTRKSSPYDNAFSSYFYEKITYDDSLILTAMDTNGTFDSANVDRELLVLNREKVKRNFNSDKFTKEVTHKDKIYLQNWHRYFFAIPINHGLARTTDCLPANVPVVLRLHRSPALFSLIKIDDNTKLTLKEDQTQTVELPNSYDISVIPIINPVLHAYYSYSPEMETKMSKVRLYNYEIPFEDAVIRRNVLESGLSEFDINLAQGKLPAFIVFGLSTIDRLSGQHDFCLTKLNQHNLTSFDLLKDGESITTFPLQGQGNAGYEFYQHYLKQTNRYMNPWSSGTSTFHDFMEYNFMVVANLDKMKIKDGALQVKLKFKDALADKLILLWMPVFNRKLVFDQNLNVTVE